MKLTEYQIEAHSFAAYPERFGPQYVSNALIEELGEFHGVIAKSLRIGIGPNKDLLLLEAGDLLWQIAEAATLLGAKLTDKAPTTRSLWIVEEVAGLVLRLKDIDFKRESPEVAFAAASVATALKAWTGFTLEQAAVANLAKLAGRRSRGVIVGQGDKR